MSLSRAFWLSLLITPLAGCGGGGTPPPQAPVRLAGVAVDSLPPEPAEPSADPAPPEPEPSLQDRWSAPFAVHSSGRALAHREQPVVAVRVADAAPVAALPSVSGAPPGGAPTAADRAGAPAVPPATRAQPPAASAPAAPPAARAAETTRTHRVEWGETWYGIARRYGVQTSTLAAANPDVDPERLQAGRVLRIPRADARADAGRRTHTVGPGDSLWGIARRYGVSMERIRAANGMRDDRVRLGQTLIIPAAEEGR